MYNGERILVRMREERIAVTNASRTCRAMLWYTIDRYIRDDSSHFYRDDIDSSHVTTARGAIKPGQV